MRRIQHFLSLSLAFSLIFPNSLSADEMILTTYYPAPAGSYVSMRSTKLCVGRDCHKPATDPTKPDVKDNDLYVQGVVNVQGGESTSTLVDGADIILKGQNACSAGAKNGGDIILIPGSKGGFGTSAQAGNVGIGIADPKVMLDVAREIKVGMSTGPELACSDTTAGSIRYNRTTNTMEFCLQRATTPSIVWAWGPIPLFNPCAGRTAGQTCEGTAAIYAGVHGYMTTPSIPSIVRVWDPAVAYCEALDFGGYSDWYLPARGELDDVLYHNKGALNMGSAYYWSATEFDSARAWGLGFSDGGQYENPKNVVGDVRCVRRY